MIAIGVGCRKACPTGDVLDLVRSTLAELAEAEAVSGLFTLEHKRGERGLAEAAATLGLPLLFLDMAALRHAAAHAQSRSARVEALFGLPCVAEAAALAGAGEGATLVVARRTHAAATCALARGAS